MSRNRVMWFVTSFVATGLIVVLASGALSDGESDEAASSTSENTDLSTSTATESTASAPTLAPLPEPDLDEYCDTIVGVGSAVVQIPDEPDQWSCRPVGGGPDAPISIASVCDDQYGARSRALLVGRSEAWRCTPEERQLIGPADPQQACAASGGEAMLIANDRDGWRCGRTENGIFAIEWDFGDSLLDNVDESCRLAFGDSAFAEANGRGPTDWQCYAPVTS